MARFGWRGNVAALVLVATCAGALPVHAQPVPLLPLPASRSIEVRDPATLPHVPLPRLPVPPTVSQRQGQLPVVPLSLDEAIRIAVERSTVVRALAGVTAVSTGRTIYDAPITNNRVAEAQSAFDPTLGIDQRWSRSEDPELGLNPLPPPAFAIDGSHADAYNMALGLTKPTVSGGSLRMGVTADPTRFRGENALGTPLLGLNPQTRSSLDLTATQPLLQGGGWAANLAPIVLARIDTEQSYFQFKDAVQGMVQGTIEAYWSLVAARTEAWAREQQVEQADFAYRLTKAKFEVNMANGGELAQTLVSLNNFRSALLAARASVLDREAALRNILGLPPSDGCELVPSTPLLKDRLPTSWDSLIELAEVRRPDVIELKLILEADQQRLLLARNEALPRADAVALYRWDGLEGELPGGEHLASRPGQFTDWSLGVNFSVPLGLRRERALLRRQELIIAKDRALLEQQLHAVAHELALSLRNLDQFFEQYEIAQETRAAARTNLTLQIESYRVGKSQFINALLAINDWGDAIRSEAEFLARYNVELARLEQQTGTILETHGIRLYEERNCMLGPLGRFGSGRAFAAALRPGDSIPRYADSDHPAEQAFGLDDPVERIEGPVPSEFPDPPPPPPVPADPPQLP